MEYICIYPCLRNYFWQQPSCAPHRSMVPHVAVHVSAHRRPMATLGRRRLVSILCWPSSSSQFVDPTLSCGQPCRCPSPSTHSREHNTCSLADQAKSSCYSIKYFSLYIRANSGILWSARLLLACRNPIAYLVVTRDNSASRNDNFQQPVSEFIIPRRLACMHVCIRHARTGLCPLDANLQFHVAPTSSV